MAVLVDPSVIVEYLRGHHGAEQVLEDARIAAPLDASEMTRPEVLVGMRTGEERSTRDLLSIIIGHPVDTLIAQRG